MRSAGLFWRTFTLNSYTLDPRSQDLRISNSLALAGHCAQVGKCFAVSFSRKAYRQPSGLQTPCFTLFSILSFSFLPSVAPNPPISVKGGRALIFLRYSWGSLFEVPILLLLLWEDFRSQATPHRSHSGVCKMKKSSCQKWLTGFSGE